MASVNEIEQKEGKVFTLIIVIGLSLGFLVRFIPSLFPIYWYDEIYTVTISEYPLASIVRHTVQDVHPPMYYFAVHGLMKIGVRLGGWFETLSWLRWSSLVPGMILIVIAWRAARRAWGKTAGLFVLYVFALAPGLAFYSVELRNYASTQAALLGATMCLVYAVQASGASQWRWAAGYVACITIAIYLHNIATIYMAAHACIIVYELFTGRVDRKQLGAVAAATVIATLLLYAPWVPKLFQQNEYVRSSELPWLRTAEWRDWISTLFFFIPYGPIEWYSPWASWGLALTIATTAAFVCALIWILTVKPIKSTIGTHPFFLNSRLFVYSIAMTIIPIGIAFVLSKTGTARIFMPTRYNYLAAPFWLLALSAIVWSIPKPMIRGGLSGVFLFLSTAFLLHVQHIRTHERYDYSCLRALKEPITADKGAFYLISNTESPWLGQCVDYRFRQIGDVNENAPSDSLPLYIVSHGVMEFPGFLEYETALLKHLIETAPTADKIELTQCWTWGTIYRLAPESFPPLAERYRLHLSEHASRKDSIPGGQVFLPGDECFRLGSGWSNVEFSSTLQPLCWTLGDEQSVTWTGPDKPGRYRIAMTFWRTHPYPSEDSGIEYKLPNSDEWQSSAAPVNAATVIGGEFMVRHMRERLTMELKVPSWIPRDHIDGALDARELGMQFLSMEIRPIADESARPETIGE